LMFIIAMKNPKTSFDINTFNTFNTA